MKKIYIPFLVAAVAFPAATLTGCIEETFPTTLVTQDQVVNSPDAAASYALGMPAFMNTYAVLGNTRLHYDFGYPSMMHIRDVMTGDMPILQSPSGYDWFDAWEVTEYQSESNIYPQLIWNTYTQMVQTANLTIGSVDPETENRQSRYYLGAGLAYRAMAYLDMARMYEYLPCGGVTDPQISDTVNVTGLTVPIVTETTTEAQARKNPRATHQQMMDFIINDLDRAEEYIVAGARPNKTLPDISCVYGLKARAYLWDGEYAKAKEYARLAISANGGNVTTREEWLSKTNGFNDLSISSWMWGGQYTSEDGAIKTSLINWASWASNEATWGYSSAEPNILIDADLYNSISNDDFRKLTFVAPEGHPLSGKENWINRAVFAQEDLAEPATYASLKIKPAGGEMVAYLVGGPIAYPLMRVEEMYFIEAEAAAMTSPSEGASLLQELIKTRNPNYTFVGSSTEDVVDEIFKQKRMEFFCEGQIFFDYKRLNKPVTRHYTGSNWRNDIQYNTGANRPAWMNFCIVQTEGNNNEGVRGHNNPDPSLKYPNLGGL